MKPFDKLRMIIVAYFWPALVLVLFIYFRVWNNLRDFIDLFFVRNLSISSVNLIIMDQSKEIGLILLFFILPGVFFNYLPIHQAAQAILASFLILPILSLGFLYMVNTLFPMFYSFFALIVGMLIAATMRLIFSSQEQMFLRRAFSQFVSEDILKDLLKHPEKLSRQGKEYLVSVMFVDIRGFTSFTERRSPQLVVTRLNELLDLVTKIILSHQGTVDKYIGDAVMAFWGAPTSDKRQARHALQAAREIKQTIETNTEFKVGIGINYGRAIVGNVGSSRRYDYTAIGDTVNTAARLESATKDLGYPILIADSVLAKCKEEHYNCPTRALGTFALKGRNRPTHIHAVI